MNYTDKLKCNRFYSSKISGRDFNNEMESDRGRAVNSAAVRRLQQKTQVFPLETNAAVRSRLTHSLEVQQVGRYIAKLVLKNVAQQSIELGLAGSEDGFISAVEISCLLHDIGNPPFGHFGEEAINQWAAETVTGIWRSEFFAYQDSALYQQLLTDLLNFEGNAQGLRLLHQLQTLNLSLTQLASLVKYTRCACDAKPMAGDEFYYRKKKPGFYLSERLLVARLSTELNIAEGCRFPLSYIMEAADDISYCIADLEDALEKGILNLEQLHQLLCKKWRVLCEADSEGKAVVSHYLLDILSAAYAAAQEADYQKNHAYILTLRTVFVNDLAQYAATRYIANQQEIFDGTFDAPLLDGDDNYNRAAQTLRLVAREHVFNHPEVEDLELKGFSVISGLLNIYTPLLLLTAQQFQRLINTDRLEGAAVATRLFHKLSDKHKAHYRSALLDIADLHFEMWERYYRVRLLIDYISGMTDQFAVQQYQGLSASKF